LPSTKVSKVKAGFRFDARQRPAARRSLPALPAAQAPVSAGSPGFRSPDSQRDLPGLLSVPQFVHRAFDRRQEMIAHVLEHELVRRQQAQVAVLFLGVQGPQPGVQLLLGELALQAVQAGCPQGVRRHAMPPVAGKLEPPSLRRSRNGSCHRPKERDRVQCEG
jgi:hypothetical protein